MRSASAAAATSPVTVIAFADGRDAERNRRTRRLALAQDEIRQLSGLEALQLDFDVIGRRRKRGNGEPSFAVGDVVRCALVPTFVTVTVAPGMAACDDPSPVPPDRTMRIAERRRLPASATGRQRRCSRACRSLKHSPRLGERGVTAAFYACRRRRTMARTAERTILDMPLVGSRLSGVGSRSPDLRSADLQVGGPTSPHC